MGRAVLLDSRIVGLGPSGARGREEMTGYFCPLMDNAPARLADRME